MGNQPPYTYDPQNPFGGEQAPGESQQGETPAGSQGGAAPGYPPSDQQGSHAGQGNQESYPPYTPESYPPPPPSYGQPAYSPPSYESPAPYQPPAYQQPNYGEPTYGQGYTPPGNPPPGSLPPAQPDYPPQPTPYADPYAQSPHAQFYGQQPGQPYGAPYAGQPYGQPYGQPGTEQYQPYAPGYEQPGQYQAPYSSPYGTPYGQAYGAPIPRQDTRAGLAIAALVLGILSLIFSCANVCDTPFIVLGLIFGAMGMQSTTHRQMAILGLVLSGIALVIAVIIFVIALGTHHYGFSPA